MSSYDETLLKDAPAATRAERQEGYNVGILAERPQSPPIAPPRSTSTPEADAQQPFPGPVTGQEPLFPGEEPLGEIESKGAPRSVPFLRTTKGTLFIVLLAIIIIAAVVGGAVGGTAGKHTSKPSGPRTTPSPYTTTASQSSASPPGQSVSGTGPTTTIENGSGTSVGGPGNSAATSPVVTRRAGSRYPRSTGGIAIAGAEVDV